MQGRFDGHRPGPLPPNTFHGAVRHPARVRDGSLYLDAYRVGERVPTAQAIIASRPAGIITDRPRSFDDFEGSLWWTSSLVPAAIDVAAAHRRRFDICSIAVTGSVGKSSTTQLIAHAVGPESIATAGNDNDEYGVPTLCLNLTEAHKYLVCEIGTWRAGEITDCTSASLPSIGVITNIGESHLSRFGSVQAIARAKKELFYALPASGSAIADIDSPWHRELIRGIDARLLTFSTDSPKADAKLERVSMQSSGSVIEASILGQRVAFELRAPGLHMVRNSLAALLAASASGVDVELGAARMAEFVAPPGRLQVRFGDDLTIIDDTFNASISSVRSLCDVLQMFRGRRLVVFGGIAELGRVATDRNVEALGMLAGAADEVIAYGPILEPLSGAINHMAGISFVATESDLRTDLALRAQPHDLIAFKGSRSSNLSAVVAACTTPTVGLARLSLRDGS